MHLTDKTKSITSILSRLPATSTKNGYLKDYKHSDRPRTANEVKVQQNRGSSPLHSLEPFLFRLKDILHGLRVHGEHQGGCFRLHGWCGNPRWQTFSDILLVGTMQRFWGSLQGHPQQEPEKCNHWPRLATVASRLAPYTIWTQLKWWDL